MAVYTEVSFEEAAELVARLGLGRLVHLHGIAGGIENTNYFATTERGDYVLTLFERLGFEQLPFYLLLMQHLAARGIPVPDPRADSAGEILHSLRGKPAAVVSRLRGQSELAPTPAHCAQVGAMLARMHLACADFAPEQPNLRGRAWWNETVPVVLPYLAPAQARLLQDELAHQNDIAALPLYQSLPRSAVHADLFRDNVMFEQGQLSGVFDFYFAGIDSWLFDLAVALNDWCIDLSSGQSDAARSAALLAAYEGVRRLSGAEVQLLPAMLRAGALRFWLSRLWDFYLPRQATMLKAHDPAHFERVLLARRAVSPARMVA